MELGLALLPQKYFFILSGEWKNVPPYPLGKDLGFLICLLTLCVII